MISEFDLIKKLKRKIPRRIQGGTGIGDDAAVLPGPDGESWLLTTDAVVDGVDFHARKIRPQDAGRKALAVNLSDIAAMGGEPVAFVAALGIPAGFSAGWIEKCYAGMIPLARRYGVFFAGGDISRSRTFFISIALLGRVRRSQAVLRSGARTGDRIAVTGRLGGSIRGRHFSFEPRLKEARFLAQRFRPSAMLDISDGLAQDLGHILEASGRGAQVDLDAVPVSKDARRMNGGPQAALRHALSDGEDFELLFTLPAVRQKPLARAWRQRFPSVPLTFIGRITQKRGLEWRQGGKKTALPVLRPGYRHF